MNSPIITFSPECSFHGYHQQSNLNESLCTCYDGHYGNICNETDTWNPFGDYIQPSEDGYLAVNGCDAAINCHGNGLCLRDGTCTCHPGYIEADCSEKVPSASVLLVFCILPCLGIVYCIIGKGCIGFLVGSCWIVSTCASIESIPTKDSSPEDVARINETNKYRNEHYCRYRFGKCIAATLCACLCTIPALVMVLNGSIEGYYYPWLH